ncbi:MAG: hypothetical protein A3J76_02195 [Candidatus Moranbacteria bacterium RBG_13_45_13]|nr:MAG: hypothetical protein A3J76_02195 [Candidatus Moranbacteria bacterium RBG_13_45_13]
MEEQKAPSSDAEKNKAMAIIGYIIPILFFIPLVSDAKNSPFAKFHANQQLNLLLFWVVGQIAGVVLSFIFIGFLIFPLVMIGGLIFMIMGIINASKGEMKELPLIGGFKLIN